MTWKWLYLVAAVIAALASMLFAARHELGWVVLGALSTWCNIYNYTNSGNKEGE